MDIRRRNFLRGRFSKKDSIILMPWVNDRATFHATCTRCSDCLKACPEGIVGSDADGYPGIDFRKGECTFCGQCTKVCSHNLFEEDLARPPWDFVATLSDQCLTQNNIACQSCQDICEQRAIRFHYSVGKVPQPNIVTTNCSGCGACVAVCPASSISILSASAAPNLTTIKQQGQIHVG